jgi:hypothetical protein
MAEIAVIGLHEESMRALMIDELRHNGYEVYEAQDPQDMVKRVNDGGCALAVMDINFGHPARELISPAEEVWGAIRGDVEKGVARFLGISGNDRVVKSAQNVGIPVLASDGPVFDKIFN